MEFNKKRIPWNKGISSKKTLQKCDICGLEHWEKHPSIKPKYCSRECYYKSKKGKPSGSSGIKWTEEQKSKLKNRKGIAGKNHWNWKGGKVKHYSTNFRRRLNRLIKERDNYMCKKCGNKSSLVVHHMDHNHKNDSLNNLITLCRACHALHHNGK